LKTNKESKDRLKIHSEWFLKIYIYVMVLIILVIYSGILPINIQQLISEQIPGLSGLLVTIDESYRQTINRISDIQYAVTFGVAVLSVIFLIWRRSLHEILGIVAFGMIPRERKVWGILRDKNTLIPVAFSEIRLFSIDEAGNRVLVAQSVSDLDGRYRIQLKRIEDKHILEVKASTYKVYTKEIKLINTLINSNLIVDDILLERDEAEQITIASQINRFRPRLNIFLMGVIFIAGLINIPIGVFATINNPVLINFIFLASTIITNIWNFRIVNERFNPKVGRVLDSHKKPIPNITVELYNSNMKLGVAKTNSKGVVKFDIEPGLLLLKPLFNSGKGIFIPVRIDTRGYLEQDIIIDSSERVEEQSLISPFN
jgi:hypothetical protein